MSESRFWKNLHPLIRRGRKPLYEDDTNYAILNAIDEELKELEEATVRSKIQSSLKTATGKYLEEYGDFFGVYRRREDEEDKEYRERIVEAVDIPRGTNESIRRAVRSYLEDSTLGIEVYEPWVDIFYLNRPTSRLSGKHKMQGVYYHFAVIDVHIGSPFEEDIVNLINDYKPAGVTLHTTYDPSLRPYDGETTGKYGTIPYVRDLPGAFENTLEMDNAYLQPVTGSIKMSDMKALDSIFNLNTSRFSSLDRLSSGYGTRLGNIHLAGVSENFKPKETTLMRHLSSEINLVDDEFYTNRDSKDNNTYKVKLRPTKQLYVILNIDELVGTRHPKLNRFSGDYEGILNESPIQVSLNTSQGVKLDLEVFDFAEMRWKRIESLITTNKGDMIKARIPKKGSYLNGNQLAFIRLVSPRDISISLNHFHMDYTSTKGTTPLGIGVEARPSHAIVVDKLEDVPEDVPYPYG